MTPFPGHRSNATGMKSAPLRCTIAVRQHLRRKHRLISQKLSTSGLSLPKSGDPVSGNKRRSCVAGSRTGDVLIGGECAVTVSLASRSIRYSCRNRSVIHRIRYCRKRASFGKPSRPPAKPSATRSSHSFETGSKRFIARPSRAATFGS